MHVFVHAQVHMLCCVWLCACGEWERKEQRVGKGIANKEIQLTRQKKKENQLTENLYRYPQIKKVIRNILMQELSRENKNTNRGPRNHGIGKKEWVGWSEIYIDGLIKST